ncbi:MAG: hypothetical protein IH841_07965 [Thaumarchaeota archaeon]|nr:hypothetical protein [Nitrososphaerota archaeon]
MSEIINDSTEKMPESSEQIGSNSEQIGFDTEKISEIIPEQIRYRGQRGPDKNTRSFNANSLRNLKQYQNIPIEKPKGSDKWIWIVIVMVIVVIAIILGWKIYEWCKEKQQEKGKTELSHS